MANQLALSVVIGAAFQGSFNSVIGRSVDQFNRVGDTIRTVESQAGKIQTFRRLRNELAQTDQAYTQAKDRVARLTREMRNTANPTQAMARELGTARREANQLNQTLGNQRRALQQHRQAMSQAGVSTTRLDQQEQQLGNTVDTLRRRYTRLGAAIRAQETVRNQRAEKRGELLDAVAIGATMAAPIRQAIQFESVMADVKKVVDFESPKAFKAMGDDILTMSTRIPMSATGLGEIMAAAGQAGIARKELRVFTEDAAKMGVAFDLTGKQAGGAMTGLRSIYKLNQKQVVLLGDSYNHLSNSMDATAADMLNISNRTGSTAQLFGLTGQQVGALGATFLALKTPPEVAATGINALLLKLKTADKQGAKFQAALAGMGMSAEGLKDSIEQDAQGALLSFFDAVKGSDDVMGTLSDMFGAEYSDDMAKLVGGMDDYKKALRLVANETAYAGSMQKEYANRSATTEAGLQRFTGHVNRLAVTVGSVLLPPLNTVLGIIGPIVSTIADVANQFPMATQAIIGTAMGLAVLKVGSIAGGYAMTFVTGGALSLSTTYHRLSAALALANVRMTTLNATSLTAAARSRALAVGGALRAFTANLVGNYTAMNASTAAWIANKTASVGGWLKSRPAAIAATTRSLIAQTSVLARNSLAWAANQASATGRWLSVLPARLSRVRFSMGAVFGVIGRLGGAFAVATKAISTLGTALMANPLGLIIGGIALAGFAVYKYWQPLGAFFSGLWSGFKQALAPVIPALQPLLNVLSPIGKVLGYIGDSIGAVVGWVGNLLTPVEMAGESLEGFASTGEQVGAVIGSVFKAMLSPITLVADAVGWIGDKWNNIFSDEKTPKVAMPKPVVPARVAKFPGEAAANEPVFKPAGNVIKLAERREVPKPQTVPLSAVAQGNLAVKAEPAAAPQISNNQSYQITINQQPGQDSRALAEDVMREIERRQGQRKQGGLYDV